jgi:predicted KAP-like P-loop ATPase
MTNSFSIRRKKIKFNRLKTKLKNAILNNESFIFCCILLFSFLLIFENKLFEIFEKSIFGTIYFSFQKGNDVADYLTLLFCLYILTITFIKRTLRFKYSRNFHTAILFILLYFVSFRYLPFIRPGLKFEFIPMKMCNIISYMELFFGSIAVSYIGILITRKKKDIESEKSKLINDIPIDKISKDKFGYYGFAKNIFQEIIKIPDTEKSFNIGINGSWGSGKTSFINIIKVLLKRYKLKKPSDHILIEFSPLQIEKENNLTVDFLLKLNSELKKFHLKSNNEIRQYINSLTSKNDNVLSAIIKLFYSEKSYEEQGKEIKKILDRINRKIIVIIDDLDRLTKDEIHEILRLIRNICDFNKMIFIVAYDKQYLIEKLDDDNDKNTQQYLEKFFSLEIALPLVNSDILKKLLIDEVNAKLPNIAQNLSGLFNIYEEDKVISQITEKDYLPLEFIDHFIGNKRDINRFVNSLSLIPEQVFRKVEIKELFLIELLKLKYLELYNSIRLKKILIVAQQNNIRLYRINNNYFNTTFKDHTQKEINFYNDVLTILFKSNLNADYSNSVSNVDKFDLYFNYNIINLEQLSELNRLRN